MKTWLGWLTALATAAVIPLGAAQHSAPMRPATGGVPGNFVYVCTAEPCQYGESLAVYDQWSDPLLAVSENSDITSYGLAYTINPLGDVYAGHGLVSLGPITPDTYQNVLHFGTGCHVPHWWIGPNDDGSKLQVWHCVAPGVWALYKTL